MTVAVADAEEQDPGAEEGATTTASVTNRLDEIQLLLQEAMRERNTAKIRELMRERNSLRETLT